MAEERKKPVAPKREKQSLGEKLRGIKVEMKKVIWPTKKELGSYTVAVLVITVFFAVAFWALDTGVLAGLKAVLGETL